MRDAVRAGLRRFMPPGVRRARRVIVRLPYVLWRSVERTRQQASRRCVGHCDSLLMHPFRRHIEDDYTVNLILCRLGLRLTTDLGQEYAAAMHWYDTTHRPRNLVLEELAPSMPLINLHRNDISKTRVDAVMKGVVGYGLAVDPLATHGPLVEKADANALHDGRIVTEPWPRRRPAGCTNA